MGGAKDQLLEGEEGGFNFSAGEGLQVCAACFTDPFLKQLVSDNVASTSCSFCETASDGPVAAPMRSVLECIGACIHTYYADAADYISYDGAEGGYQWTTYDREELLEDLGMDEYLADGRDKLRKMIIDAVEERDWCDVDAYGMTEQETLSFSWRSLSTSLRHPMREITEQPDRSRPPARAC